MLPHPAKCMCACIYVEVYEEVMGWSAHVVAHVCSIGLTALDGLDSSGCALGYRRRAACLVERQSSRAKGPSFAGTRQRPNSPSRKAHLPLVMVLGWMAWQDGLRMLSSARRPSNPVCCTSARLAPGCLVCRVPPFQLCNSFACVVAHDSVPDQCRY